MLAATPRDGRGDGQPGGYRFYSQELVGVHLRRQAAGEAVGVKARDVERALFMAHKEYQEGRLYRRPR